VEAEDKDWNEEWEKNFFQPIVIEDRCCIHSTFHHDTPPAEYEILINPQMAFGTGHHETTSSIIAELLDTDLLGKRVLDMGCGTSILAILASMRGAREVTAIDIDDWCVNNSRDNIALNNCTNITVELGDAHSLAGREPFDVVIANINRNILLADMPAYAAVMKAGSQLLMSGFYVEDIPAIRQMAESLGFRFEHHREKNRWAAVKFVKGE
jgi:ribosomal protein L11 methyltransferase